MLQCCKKKVRNEENESSAAYGKINVNSKHVFTFLSYFKDQKGL